MTARSVPKICSPIPSIPKILRYVEWAFLGMVTLRALFPILYEPIPYEVSGGDYLNFCVLGILAILSWFFPIHRPMWRRQAYIFIEIACLLPTRLFSNWGLDLLLHLYLLKSDFLLRRRDVIITAILAGVAWHFSLLKSTPAKQVAIAIRNVQQGYSQLGPTIAPKVFSQIKSAAKLPKINRLTLFNWSLDKQLHFA